MHVKQNFVKNTQIHVQQLKAIHTYMCIYSSSF